VGNCIDWTMEHVQSCNLMFSKNTFFKRQRYVTDVVVAFPDELDRLVEKYT